MSNEITTPKRISIIGWTPVEEVLPKKYGWYLTWNRTAYSKSKWWEKRQWINGKWIPCGIGVTVTHWAEVTPPEVENDPR